MGKRKRRFPIIHHTLRDAPGYLSEGAWITVTGDAYARHQLRERDTDTPVSVYTDASMKDTAFTGLAATAAVVVPELRLTLTAELDVETSTQAEQAAVDLACALARSYGFTATIHTDCQSLLARDGGDDLRWIRAHTGERDARANALADDLARARLLCCRPKHRSRSELHSRIRDTLRTNPGWYTVTPVELPGASVTAAAFPDRDRLRPDGDGTPAIYLLDGEFHLFARALPASPTLVQARQRRLTGMVVEGTGFERTTVALSRLRFLGYCSDLEAPAV